MTKGPLSSLVFFFYEAVVPFACVYIPSLSHPICSKKSWEGYFHPWTHQQVSHFRDKLLRSRVTHSTSPFPYITPLLLSFLLYSSNSPFLFLSRLPPVPGLTIFHLHTPEILKWLVGKLKEGRRGTWNRCNIWYFQFQQPTSVPLQMALQRNSTGISLLITWNEIWLNLDTNSVGFLRPYK